MEKKQKPHKKICWVTSGWFADVDIPVIPLLLDNYSIHWIIVLYKGGRYKESEFDYLNKYSNLIVEFIHVNQRARHPKTIIDYFKLLFKIKRVKADCVYFDIAPNSPYFIIPYCLLNKNRTIFAAHDGSIKSIMGMLTKFSYRICYGWHAKNVHMFSQTQAKEFHINYPGKYVTVIPLMPKDYGRPSSDITTKKNSFLSFGSMHKEKNIGLLIQAVESLYDKGYKDLHISICGQPVDWEIEYAPLVKHKELFNLQLRMIDNKEIPDMFASHQFVVYPYKMMSQSGALKVAYAYKKPVITSDLPAFKEEVADGINGFTFQSENVDALADVMRQCIEMTSSDYSDLLLSVSSFIDNNYSKAKIRNSYIEMFNKVLNQ